MFRNICHLSLKVGIVEDVTSYGAAMRRLRVGRSRLLFLSCVFYAFNDMPTQLKTLSYYVKGHKSPHVLTANGLFLMFWPLKLLAGRVQVEIRAMPKEPVTRISLHKMVDIGFPVIKGCQRFAQC